MSQLLLIYGLSPACLLLAGSTHLWGQDPLFFVFEDLLLTVVEFRQPRQLFAQDAKEENCAQGPKPQGEESKATCARNRGHIEFSSG